jgi:acyl carrier protein
MQNAILKPSFPPDTFRLIFADLQRSGEISPQIEIGPDFESKSLEDIGLDSVGRVALLASIEESFGIVLDDEDFTIGMTIRDLVQLIQARMAR